MKAKILLCVVLFIGALGTVGASAAQSDNATFKVADRLQS